MSRSISGCFGLEREFSFEFAWAKRIRFTFFTRFNDMADLTHNLRGIIPPLVTPLLDREMLDIEGLEKLLNHVISGGVHGLFILSSTGEAPGLSYKLRYELIDRVCKTVNSKIPVLVGISDTSSAESLNLARYSAEKGAQFLVLAPPYYFPIDHLDVLDYFKHLVKDLPLPVILYNAPGFTKIMLEPETVCKAAEIPGIIGIKDSSGSMSYFHTLKAKMADHADFRFFVGPESLLAEFTLFGGHGGILGGANLFPKLFVDIYNSACEDDVQKCRKYQDIVIEISTSLYSVGGFLKGIKCAMELMGICRGLPAEPLHPLNEKEQKKIQSELERLQRLMRNHGY